MTVGPDPKMPSALGKELRLAASQGRLAQLRLLLRAGAPPEEEGEPSALCLAIAAGSPECAQALMEAGARVGASEAEPGHTPLSLAARMGDEATMERLARRGAPINERLCNGETAFTLALRQGDCWAMELLIKAGAKAAAAEGALLEAAFRDAPKGRCFDLAWALWEREQISALAQPERKGGARAL